VEVNYSTWSNADIRYEYHMRPNSVAKEPDPYVFVYRGIPGNHLVLKNVPNYEFCHAKRFPGEGPAFCYRND